MKNFPKILIFPLLLMALPSCAPKQAKPVAARPLTITEPILQALNSLAQPLVPVDSLSGLAEVEIEVRGRKEFFQVALLAETPNRLRLSLLDDLGQEQGRFVADGRRVLWIDRRNGTWEHLDQGDDSLKRVLKLPLTVEEFIQRILAKVPPGKTQDVKMIDTNKVELSQMKDRYEIQINPPRLSTWQSFPDDRQKKRRFQVSYGNFQKQSERDFPQSFTWNFRKPKAQVTLEFLSLRLNPDLTAEIFDTSAPAEY